MPGRSGAAPVYELSGWWRRVGAAIIDSIIVGLISMPLFVLFLVVVLGESFAGNEGDGVWGIWFDFTGNLIGTAITVAVGLLYPALMMSKTNGQTVGKMATDIRVVRESGAPITYGFALLRELVVKAFLFQTVGGMLVIVPLIDALWPLWDDKNQALHDKIVSTRVVRATQVFPVPYAGPAGWQQVPPPQPVAPSLPPQAPPPPPPPPQATV